MTRASRIIKEIYEVMPTDKYVLVGHIARQIKSGWNTTKHYVDLLEYLGLIESKMFYFKKKYRKIKNDS